MTMVHELTDEDKAKRYAGHKVAVYFNIRTRRFSVLLKETGRVIFHADQVVLRDARFKVSEAGRQRVLREKRKNVHAMIEGTLDTLGWTLPGDTPQAYYNPYVTETFVDRKTQEPLHFADFVFLTGGHVYYISEAE